MIGARQAIEREHAKDGGDCGEEDGHLKSNRNPGGPAIERAAADILGVIYNSDPILKEKSAQAANDAADESDKGDARAAETQRVGQARHGEGAEGVHAA